MNAIASAEITMKHAELWVSPSQCRNTREWIHHRWVERSYFEGSNSLVFVLRRRWLGFEFEFVEHKRVPYDMM